MLIGTRAPWNANGLRYKFKSLVRDELCDEKGVERKARCRGNSNKCTTRMREKLLDRPNLSGLFTPTTSASFQGPAVDPSPNVSESCFYPPTRILCFFHDRNYLQFDFLSSFVRGCIEKMMNRTARNSSVDFASIREFLHSWIRSSTIPIN